jgi:hypothetical protein
MSDFYEDMSPLDRVLYRSSPRTHEYVSLTGKIRRSERKKALEQIHKLYSPCTPEEAVMIYDAFKDYAVGTNGRLVEIDVELVPAEVAEWAKTNTNPFVKYLTFFGRIGGTMGTLLFDNNMGGYRFNSAVVSKTQIDQVWKFVPTLEKSEPR